MVHSSIGRTDDGSDQSTISSKLAESAVCRGIGKMTPIDTISLQAALKDRKDVEKYSFSRSITVPRTVLHLAAGPLALVNVSFLVADGELAVQDLLFGLPVLQHLGVDSKTLVEQRHGSLDGFDCSALKAAQAGTHGNQVGRLMIARLNRPPNPVEISAPPLVDSRPRDNYFKVREEKDPFPDFSLLDPVDSVPTEQASSAIEKMLEDAADQGFLEADLLSLRKLVWSHSNIFRISLSSSPFAEVPPLKIDLVPDARPTRVRLCNYSREQCNFLSSMVEDLVANGLAYSNPSSPWALAPLLVPKPSPAKFRFTVDLRPGNQFTVKHQFPMLNFEQELT